MKKKITTLFFVIALLLISGCTTPAQPEVPSSDRFETEKPWINSTVFGTVRDTAYDPDLKDDFYVAVNHDWMMKSKFRPGYTSDSSFDDLSYDLKSKLKALMSDTSLDSPESKNVTNLYDLWLNWDRRNGIDYITEIRKHTGIVEKISSIKDLSDYLVSDEFFYHGAELINAGIGIDKLESKNYNIELSPTTLTLGDPAEYKELTANGEREKQFADGISQYMLEYIGYSSEDAKTIIEKKYAFENKIASCQMSVAQQSDPSAVELTYNPVTLEELETLSPKFPYVKYLENIGFAGSKLINLQEPEWLKGFNELYTEDNLEEIKAYLIDQIASSYIALIDEDSYRYLQDLQSKRYGNSDRLSDEELAFNYVSTNLSSSVSRIFVEKFMTPQIKEEITDIISEAVGYYREMLSETEWLSKETRDKAIEKLDHIGINAAYPDKWKDDSGLTILSSSEGETLLSAEDKLNRFYYQTERDYINTQIDRNYWLIENVAQVNSFYSPSTNEIYIIAGILGGDFYSSDFTYEEKLGAIGSVIGHELSHAFDTIGSQYDKDGNVSSWWTKEDYQKFQERTNRLIDYLSSMTVDGSGKNYNGALVQTETIADMAGIKCMLGLAAKKEDFDYDRFFRAYANVWKKAETKEKVDARVLTDVHALAYLRVNAVLQQFEEFYETYDIKEGDGMYLPPEERVAVW